MCVCVEEETEWRDGERERDNRGLSGDRLIDRERRVEGRRVERASVCVCVCV